MSNTFGQLFKITTFGESHGPSIGVVIDGCPAGLYIDENFIQSELDKRRPGQSKITTQRKESDRVSVLSGIFEGTSTGAPIALIIPNEDKRPEDYGNLKDLYRPSHADYTWEKKYGFRDYRGGGRSSARETAARVAAGAVAQLLLNEYNISIFSFVSQVGSIRISNPVSALDLSAIESNVIRCPDKAVALKMIEAIEKVRAEGDTIGGTVTCVVKGIGAGLGEPVFDKLNARLAFAMMGINAAHGFDYGEGFEGIEKKGSELNDVFVRGADSVETESNYSGGILGGISNGNDIVFRTLFKPVSTLLREQKTVTVSGSETTFTPKGRHDPCVLPRAVPIVQAMAALVIADLFLLNKTSRIDKLK